MVNVELILRAYWAVYRFFHAKMSTYMNTLRRCEYHCRIQYIIQSVSRFCFLPFCALPPPKVPTMDYDAMDEEQLAAALDQQVRANTALSTENSPCSRAVAWPTPTSLTPDAGMAKKRESPCDGEAVRDGKSDSKKRGGCAGRGSPHASDAKLTLSRKTLQRMMMLCKRKSWRTHQIGEAHRHTQECH